MEYQIQDVSHFAPWVNEEGYIFEHSGQAPSPSKDFCQILVTPSQVIYRWWKISNRSAETQRLNPGEIKECHEDFLHDERTQTMIMCTFGQPMVDYLVNLCQGHLDYLQRLPEKAILDILLYLDLEDIGKLSLLNKTFHKICNGDDLWRTMFGRVTAINDELEELSRDHGWKKLFYSNKLQIQMQLRRKKKTEITNNASRNENIFLTHDYHDETRTEQ